MTPDSTTVPRERLSVDRIVTEALALAEQEGVRGISMRPLAARFGVSATALYGHVASRDALLGLMLDSILARVPGLDDDLEWDEALRLGAIQMREAFEPYPQLALEALGGHAATADTAASAVNLIGRLTAAGFDEAEAQLVLATWGRWTLSYIAAAAHTADGSEEMTRRAFEQGVDVLLAGLHAQLAAKR